MAFTYTIDSNILKSGGIKLAPGVVIAFGTFTDLTESADTIHTGLDDAVITLTSCKNGSQEGVRVVRQTDDLGEAEITGASGRSTDDGYWLSIGYTYKGVTSGSGAK